MAGTDWNPALYTRFEDERTRPARDLLERCRLPGRETGAGARIVDLGCGPGNSTELLRKRFPEADILGIDTSPAMLDAARRRLPECRFELGDIARFAPDQPFDLIYANASLQWVGGHETLVPRLFAAVAPGGLLAFQVPDNLAEPSQVAMRDIAQEPGFQAVLGQAAEGREAIASRGRYYDLVQPADDVDVWTTIYEHRMDDADAITQWYRSTGLKPFVDPLPDDLRANYLARYTERIAETHPVRRDGRRLLAFPRLFLVARKPAQA